MAGEMTSEPESATTVPPEVAYYYPEWHRRPDEHGWVKSLLLFFDEIALLVLDYKRFEPANLDPTLAGALQLCGCPQVPVGGGTDEWRDLGSPRSGYAMTPSAHLLPMSSGLDNHLEPRGTAALGHHRCLALASRRQRGLHEAEDPPSRLVAGTPVQAAVSWSMPSRSRTRAVGHTSVRPKRIVGRPSRPLLRK